MPETIITEKLNLSKGVVVNLIKEKGIEGQKANVVLCMDYSGSMSNLYSKGFVQQVLERIVPVSMAFDTDGAMDMYIFEDVAYRVLPDVTEDNLHGYVRDNIMAKYSYGGTSYAPAINMIVRKFTKDNNADILDEESVASKIGGAISSLFGGKKKTQQAPAKQVTADIPTYVIFITDGENFDKPEAQEAITEAAKHGIFFQFIGLQASGSEEFKFLKKLDKMEGRFIDNANFLELTDKDLVTLQDKELYDQLLSEFPSWTKEARQKLLIK